jgi:hypothetical protein
MATSYVSVTGRAANMGKHDIIEPSSTIKPSSTGRVRKHRLEMRAKGFRLKSVWVRDLADPAFTAEIARTNQAIADFEGRYPDEVKWMDGLMERAWADLPD